MKTVYLWLRHPNGRNSIKKFKTSKKTNKAIVHEYLVSSHHLNTEAYPEEVFKKKPSMKMRKEMF